MQKYLCDDAEYVAVALGSMATQIADVVDRLREEGPKAGLLALSLYRPFPSELLAAELCGRKGVIVFEKALSFGHSGALYADLQAALYPHAARPVMRELHPRPGGEATGAPISTTPFASASSAAAHVSTRWGGSVWAGRQAARDAQGGAPEPTSAPTPPRSSTSTWTWRSFLRGYCKNSVLASAKNAVSRTLRISLRAMRFSVSARASVRKFAKGRTSRGRPLPEEPTIQRAHRCADTYPEGGSDTTSANSARRLKPRLPGTRSPPARTLLAGLPPRRLCQRLVGEGRLCASCRREFIRRPQLSVSQLSLHLRGRSFPFGHNIAGTVNAPSAARYTPSLKGPLPYSR